MKTAVSQKLGKILSSGIIYKIHKISSLSNDTNLLELTSATAQKIDRKLRIWSHLLKKSLMANFIFCALPEVTLLRF